MFAKSTLVFTTLVLGAFTQISSAALTLDGPSDISMCGTASFKVAGGTPPYQLNVWNACSDDDNADDADKPLFSYKIDQATATVEWNVNIAEYRNIQLGVSDSTGKVVYTDDYTVKTSTSGSCTKEDPKFNLAGADPAPADPAPAPPATQSPDASPAPPPAITPSTGGSNTGTGNAGGPIGGAAANGASSTVASFALISLVSAAAIFMGMC